MAATVVVREGPAVRARTVRGERSGDAGIADLDERLKLLRESIRVVQRAVDELDNMPQADVDALADEQRHARARAIRDGLLGLQRLRNAELRVLNDAFEERLPELQRATADLREALRDLQDVVAFIDAASSAISIVANVVSVIA